MNSIQYFQWGVKKKPKKHTLKEHINNIWVGMSTSSYYRLNKNTNLVNDINDDNEIQININQALASNPFMQSDITRPYYYCVIGINFTKPEGRDQAVIRIESADKNLIEFIEYSYEHDSSLIILHAPLLSQMRGNGGKIV